MEITEKLLRNEVRYLGEDLKALSTELICITQFLKLQFGERFAAFRENQLWTSDSGDSHPPPPKKPNPPNNSNSNSSRRNTNPRTVSTSSETSRPRIKGSRTRVNIISDGESKTRLKNSREITELPDPAQNDVIEAEFQVVEESTTVELEVPSSPFMIEDDSQSLGDEFEDVDAMGDHAEIIVGDVSDSDVSRVGSDNSYGMRSPKRKIRKSDDPDFNPSERHERCKPRISNAGSRTRAEQGSETSQAHLKSKMLPRTKSTPTRIDNGYRSVKYLKKQKTNNTGFHSAWKYFSLDSKTNQSKCLITGCNTNLKSGRFTTSLLTHLKFHHANIHLEVVEEWKARTDARKAASVGGAIKPVKLKTVSGGTSSNV